MLVNGRRLQRDDLIFGMAKQSLDKQGFPGRLRWLMARNGMLGTGGQTALAKRANVKPSSVNNWLSGGHGIKDGTAAKLADVFGVSLPWLLWGSGDAPDGFNADRDEIVVTGDQANNVRELQLAIAALFSSLAFERQGEAARLAGQMRDGKLDELPFLKGLIEVLEQRGQRGAL